MASIRLLSLISINGILLYNLSIFYTTLALASSTITVRPSSGRATLIPGQPLHFQCEMIGNKNAQFWWYRRPVGDTNEILLEPNNDENYEIHNDRFTLLRPNSQWTGDYICRAILDVDKYSSSLTEFATIQVRTQPYIEDFGSDTSHTGKSSVVTDGERLELTCSVRDTVTPVNITWLRSVNPDDERTMVVLPDTPKSAMISSNDNADTFMVSDQNIIVEPVTNHSKRLIIESVKHEHRSYYVCLVDNGVTERARKVIFVRVKDRLVALWPFLGIVAELFILFTIIHVWETQRAYKEIHATPQNPPITTGNKRPASGASVAFESVPLTNG